MAEGKHPPDVAHLYRRHAEPLTDLRSLLATGDVTDEGELQIGGRTVRRLVIEQHSEPSRGSTRRGGDVVRRFVYDVDPHTFAPVQATMTISVPSRPNALRLTTRLHVDAYKRIPLTATTGGLLHIQTTPQTRVIVHTAEERRAREEQFRKSCHKLKSGALACKPPGIAPPKLP